MKLNENYNRAEQKYGKELAQLILSIGIPNEYVFIACQYHKEDNIPLNVGNNIVVDPKI